MPTRTKTVRIEFTRADLVKLLRDHVAGQDNLPVLKAIGVEFPRELPSDANAVIAWAWYDESKHK